MKIAYVLPFMLAAAGLAAPASALDNDRPAFHHGDNHNDRRINHIARRLGERFTSNATDNRDGRRRGGFGYIDAYADGDWAMANNRSWNSDSFNDWWHDRPDRAYPRWVQEQQRSGTCDERRMWWSGSGWRC